MDIKYKSLFLGLISVFISLMLSLSCGIGRKIEKISVVPDKPGTEIAAGAIKVWWIGHATVLIQIKDKFILTDPNFSDRVGYLVKRYVEPGLMPKDLPAITATLISHVHLDHFDIRSLRSIDSSGVLLIPPGIKEHMPQLPFRKIRALESFETEDASGVKITAVPVQHFGGRLGIDVLWNEKAYTGYIIEYQGLTVFFGGDTGYHNEIFKETGKKYKIDVALVPFGPAGNGPSFFQEFRKEVHTDPSEAIQLFRDLGATYLVPIHYQTFYVYGEPELSKVNKAITEAGLGERLVRLSQGQSHVFQIAR